MSKQYLFRVTLLNKKDKSPLDTVAYYSGQTQINAFTNEKFEPSQKKQVLYTSLVVPDNELYFHLPDYLQVRNKKKDIVNNARNTLWKNIDYYEKRMDSQFCRRFEMSIPSFLTIEEVKKMSLDFSQELANYGMIVDMAIHKTNNNNISLNNFLFADKEAKDENDDNQDYGCFFICTLRPFENGIFQNKQRLWNSKELLILWRKTWLDLLKDTINSNNTNYEDKISWINKLKNYAPVENQFKNKM